MGDIIKGKFSPKDNDNIEMKSADVVDIFSKDKLIEGKEKPAINLAFIGCEWAMFNMKSFYKIMYSEEMHAILIWFHEPVEDTDEENPDVWDVQIPLNPEDDGYEAYNQLMEAIRCTLIRGV